MPILWRYLLAHFLKTLLFCTAAFIALLLTLRLDEIAHFATLGPQGIFVLYFTCYQIPYILPIALPISALISATVLFKRLSKHHELTAFRAAGLSIYDLLAPLLLAASFFAIVNFYIVSELSTNSHLSSSLIKNELRCINPLLLLSNKHLMKVRGVYFDTLGASRVGETASKIVAAMPSKKNGFLSVLIAENLQASPSNFSGQGITLLTGLKGSAQTEQKNDDRLMIENIGNATTSIKDFSQMVQKKTWTLNNDHLQMSLLITRLKNYKDVLRTAQAENKPLNEIKQIQRSINRIYTEMIRRLSIAFALFSFTLMGACCGISISRNRSIKGMLLAITLAGFYIASYFSAKNIDHLLLASISFYIVPHLVIIGSSLWMLRRITRGVE